MRDRRVPGIVGGLSLLVLGGVLGIALDRVWLAHGGGEPSPAERHERALALFRDRLHLDEGQVRAIDSVFRLHQRAVDSSWHALRPHLASAVESVHAEIEAILDPEQVEAFHRWIASSEAAAVHGRHP